MKPLEEFLKERLISYIINDDVLVIYGSLYLTSSDIEFPKKVRIKGCLDAENCHNIILPEYLETEGYIDLNNTEKVTIPNIIKCTWLDMSDSDIDKFPSELTIATNKGVYISDDFNMDLIPSSSHEILSIKIFNRCKWGLWLSKENLSIGCKNKSVENWEIFFNNNEYYETNPDTPEYARIKEAFEYAKLVHNNVFK